MLPAKPGKLGTRLTLSYAAMLLCALVVFTVGTAAIFHFQLRRQLGHYAVQDIETVEGLMYFTPEGRLEVNENYHNHPQSKEVLERYLEVRSPDGALLFRNERLGDRTLGGNPTAEEGVGGYSERSCDGAFGNLQAELQEFTVDPRRSPAGVLCRHPADESPDLVARLGPTAAAPRKPAPIQAKSRAMPSDHRLRLDDYQNIRPSRPQAPKGGPEKAVEAIQWRPRAFAFQHSDLLPQGEDLKRSSEAASEENTEGRENGRDQIEHESTL